LRLLLDTHVFLWWCADDSRLSEQARTAIADPENEVSLSAASVWEMAIKESLGRLTLPEPVSRVTVRLGFRALPITFEHAEAAGRLPSVHRDPFDRMLVAQAWVEGLTLVTHDPAILACGGVSFLPS